MIKLLGWLVVLFFGAILLMGADDYVSHRSKGRTAFERDEIRARAALKEGWRRVVDGPVVR